MSFSDPLLTKSDVAVLLRCSERTVERQVRSRAFPPPQRFGKESLWFQSVIHNWLAQRRDEQQNWANAQTPQHGTTTPSNNSSGQLPVEIQMQAATPRSRLKPREGARGHQSIFTEQQLLARRPT